MKKLISTILFIVSLICVILAALSTPIAIGTGIYKWALSDIEFKYALWEAFKMWLTMIGLGVFIGLPCYWAGNKF
jgi:hypothetical protein